jgi:hypothetical protein
VRRIINFYPIRVNHISWNDGGEGSGNDGGRRGTAGAMLKNVCRAAEVGYNLVGRQKGYCVFSIFSIQLLRIYYARWKVLDKKWVNK